MYMLKFVSGYFLNVNDGFLDFRTNKDILRLLLKTNECSNKCKSLISYVRLSNLATFKIVNRYLEQKIRFHKCALYLNKCQCRNFDVRIRQTVTLPR